VPISSPLVDSAAAVAPVATTVPSVAAAGATVAREEMDKGFTRVILAYLSGWYPHTRARVSESRSNKRFWGKWGRVQHRPGLTEQVIRLG
jgi:hypothetical protein